MFVVHCWLLLVELDAMAGDVPLRKYTWGRDLAGLTEPGAQATGPSEPRAQASGALGTDGVSLLTAAGGIGGLLAVWDSADTPSNTADDLAYVFFYDANGNVSQVVDIEDLANWQSLGLTGPADWHASRLAARYEYDPYGNLIGPDTNGDGVFNSADDPGPYASRNPFRFSTKSFDDETGFGYWGYRYLWPKLGRWLNRDPIGELGGVNLYAYAQNSPAAAIDPLGQYCIMGNPCDGPGEPDPCPQGGPPPSQQPDTPPPAVMPSIIGGPLPPLPPVINYCPSPICAKFCAAGWAGFTTCDPITNQPCICVCPGNIGRLCNSPPCGPAPGILQKCVLLHESHHVTTYTNRNLCTGAPPPGGWPGGPSDECTAQTIDILCAKRNANRCLSAGAQACSCLQMLYQFVLSANCRTQHPRHPCPPGAQKECELARRMAKVSLRVLMQRMCH